MGAEARLRPGCNAVRNFPGPIREERRPTSRNTVRGGALASNVKRSLVSACKEARISYGRKVKGGFTFHDLRHTFNTYIRRGWLRSVIMQITGHSTLEMFDRYNMVDEEDARVAITRLQGYLTSGPQEAVRG